ncbi:hypothetical protein OEZ86_009316 [Tetradesmus obliquus]|nr:hypothetical protein OEZ86_009316 [Tetradesmus obliquus]
MAPQKLSTWKAHGSQQDFMQRDNCIIVTEDDAVTGTANKYDSHRFLPEQPRGLLHRAFSVFLFNSEGKLLLQQRATDKITFPGVWTNTCCSHPLYGQQPNELDCYSNACLRACSCVWTNTCCSHPLYGQQPNELDPDEAIADASVPGAKAAAVRKLQHELGISPQQLPADRFKFLTRLHYCAADTDTHGPDAEWGEHEIDYILLAQADVDLQPNPEEVAAVKHVDLQELQAMMDPASGLKWSPWFRIIAQHFLPTWWAELQTTLSTDKHVEAGTIHRLDC